MNNGAQEFIDNAVSHNLLNEDTAAKLASEAKRQNLTPQTYAIKAGVLDSWQIETLRILSQPKGYVPGFEIEAVLGRGGFGTVFRAIQLNLDRPVALKTIPLSSLGDRTATQRFEREAKIIGNLQHPNIVAAHDFGYHNDLLYLSLELVEGRDLSDFLGQQGPVDEVTTWQMMKQVASALVYACSLNITHRDIKPGNLMLTSAPAGYPLPANVPLVKVADFGLACFTRDTPGDNTITIAGRGLGTPSYVAPEQLSDLKVDQRADIYSIGATAFHMLTGQPAYQDISPAQVMATKTTGKENWIERLSGIASDDSIQLIRAMTEFDLEARVSSHQDLIQRIDRLLSSSDMESDGFSMAALEQNENVSTPNLLSGNDFQVKPADPTATFASTRSDSSNDNETQDFLLSEDASISPMTDSSSTGRRWWIAAAVASVAGGFLLVAWGWSWLSGNLESTSSAKPVQPRWKMKTGQIIRVFDGRKVNNSSFLVRGGQWQKSFDDEGSGVMMGNNCRVRFPCQSSQSAAFDFFDFSVGVKLQAAKMISFSALTESTDSANLKPPDQVFSIELDSQGYRVKQGDQELKSAAWEVPLNELNGYIAVEIQRDNRAWNVLINRQEFISLPDGKVEPATIELQVRNGEALFEGPSIIEQIPVE